MAEPKLTPQQIDEIVWLYANKKPHMNALAEKYGVSRVTIRNKLVKAGLIKTKKQEKKPKEKREESLTLPERFNEERAKNERQQKESKAEISKKLPKRFEREMALNGKPSPYEDIKGFEKASTIEYHNKMVQLDILARSTLARAQKENVPLALFKEDMQTILGAQRVIQNSFKDIGSLYGFGMNQDEGDLPTFTVVEMTAEEAAEIRRKADDSQRFEVPSDEDTLPSELGLDDRDDNVVDEMG